MLKRVVDWLLGSKSSIPKNRVFIKGESVILREKNIKDLADDYRWRTDTELSELDATRRNHIVDYIGEYDQCIITTAEVDSIPKDFADRSNFLNVNYGKISPNSNA